MTSNGQNRPRSHQRRDDEDDGATGGAGAVLGFTLIALAAYGVYRLISGPGEPRSLSGRREDDLLDRLAREEFLP